MSCRDLSAVLRKCSIEERLASLTPGLHTVCWQRPFVIWEKWDVCAFTKADSDTEREEGCSGLITFTTFPFWPRRPGWLRWARWCRQEQYDYLNTPLLEEPFPLGRKFAFRGQRLTSLQLIEKNGWTLAWASTGLRPSELLETNHLNPISCRWSRGKYSSNPAWRARVLLSASGWVMSIDIKSQISLALSTVPNLIPVRGAGDSTDT